MDKLPPEAIAALAARQLIEAIKIVRDKTGMDLKSSKEAVERYANGAWHAG
jgi:ribosomal protein L7/L12